MRRYRSIWVRNGVGLATCGTCRRNERCDQLANEEIAKVRQCFKLEELQEQLALAWRRMTFSLRWVNYFRSDKEE